MERRFHRKCCRRKPSVLFSAPLSSVFVNTAVLVLMCWASHLVEGTVFPEVEFLTEPPPEVLVPEGKSVVLDCEVKVTGSRGQVKVTWHKHGGQAELQDNSHRETLTNHSLHIKALRHSRGGHSDVGVYRCVVSVPGVGTVHSRKSRVGVTHLSKKFEQEPQPLTLAPGDTAAFECVIDGRPQKDIDWYKGDRKVSKNLERFVYPTGMLEIRSVRPSDYGEYACVASVGDKERTSRMAELTRASPGDPRLEGIPEFVVRPRAAHVVLGEMAFLHCVVQNRDRKGNPPLISWLRDGTTIHLKQNNTAMEIMGAGTLYIKSVTQADSGLYTCRAHNQIDSVDADARLSVIVPPKFLKVPASTRQPAQSDVTLECQVLGVPSPRIYWLKDGGVLQTSNYVKISSTGSLTINGLLTSDSGMYQCVAENEAGEVQTSAVLQVTEKAGQILAVETQSLTSSRVVNLRTELVSARFIALKWDEPDVPSKLPTTHYNVYWREMDSERERVSETERRELHIQELKPGTKYEIRVRAFTKKGASSNEETVTVTTKDDVMLPSPPQNLSLRTLNSTSIKAEWEPPQDPKGQIESYTLIYLKEGEKEEKVIKNVFGTAHSYTLTNLQEYSKYLIRVHAVTEHGTGFQTMELTGQTYSAKPSASPQHFSLEVTSSTSLIVRWEPPPKSEQNGLITGYKIRFRRKGKPGNTVSTAGDRTTYALKQLQKGQEYQVRLSAITVNGTGPATPWETAVTFIADLDESRIPPRPAQLLCTPKANSITVSWAPPDPHSKILVKGYLLSYGKGVPDVFQVKVEANTYTYHIKNLQPASEYVIKIRAFNGKGMGPEKLETVSTSEESELDMAKVMPPMGLNAHVMSPSSILLTWADHSLSRGRIIDNRYYNIKYRALSGRLGKYRFINATDLNQLIDGLRPNTEYEFMVKLVKGPRRESEYSMAVRNKTDEKAPDSEPRDVTPVALESDPLAVSLNWQPPALPNGQITGYLIYYTNDLHQEELLWPMEGVVGDKLSTIIDKLTPDTTYHFKVQARNSKGLSRRSKAVTYVTPKVEVPLPSEGTKGQGLTTNVIIIIGACVAAFVFCTCVIAVIVYLCVCRTKPSSNTKNLVKASKMPPAPVKQPPDLWIHQPSNLELHKMDRRSDSSASVATSTLRRGSRGSGDDDQASTLDRRRNSYIGDGGYPSSSEERYQPIQPRNLIRPKPITLPGDPQGGFRDPIATVTASPNGHILQYGDSPGGPMPMRPIYPRTQYNTQYSNAARVNAGDVPHTCPPSTKALQSVDEDDRDHELTGGMEDSFSSRIGYVKPQPNISPYKKPNAPVTSGPPGMTPNNKGQRTPVSFNSKSPELKTKKEEADLSKSLSTEELTAEMANLEGLMKDLNAITQQEFEC